ncbi:hypothetical protein V8C37DRAFT_417462 [Trichoderma ceciliae]
MGQTRAQGAAKRGNHSSEDLVQDAPTRQRLQQRSYHKSSQDAPLQGTERKRAIQDTLALGDKPSPKRPRMSRSCDTEAPGNEAVTRPASLQIDLIGFWARKKQWPLEFREPDITERALARKRSLYALGRRKRSDSASSASATRSGERPRAEKSAPYRDQRYKALLATKGYFMDKSDLGITEDSKKTYYALLTAEQAGPSEFLFRDDIFEQTCQSVEDRNEARVLRDITPLVCPSAEILTIYGATHLKCLIESTNAGWSNSDPLTGICPQPDYSVGFRREAFTEDQLAKLSPFIGDFIAGDLSLFMATYYMYFPFLSCEAKCGAAALDIADRQNAHSMFLAVRGVTELFHLVKREDEIHREILAFSISHDHQSVRIYGYYPVIDEQEDKFYRHPIRNFSFTDLDGKEKWAAYQFTRNIYDTWMPNHFKKICSAIDQLSLADFNAPAFPKSTGLAQGLENLAPSEDSAAGQMDTPATSFFKTRDFQKEEEPS